MTYRIDPRGAPAEGLRDALADRLDKAIAALEDWPKGLHEAIHDARKKFKKYRGALLLMRGVNRDVARGQNARIRDAARLLGDARDAAALVETATAIRDAAKDERERAILADLVDRLTARRDRLIEADEALEARMADVVSACREARSVVEALPQKGKRKRHISSIAAGYARTIRRGRDALKAASRSGEAEDFHELRKHVKYHGMHCELLAGLWPSVMDARMAEAKAAGDKLGEDHNLAALAEALAAENNIPVPARAAIDEIIAAHSAGWRSDGLAAASRLFAGDAQATAQWVVELFEAASGEQEGGTDRALTET
ncbi:MAG TPA: CHAD domain-containing protein [Rhizobiaceae bacterium]|nr:CHAD domain-containing protein [Rhizobiaceae bacterium]